MVSPVVWRHSKRCPWDQNRRRNRNSRKPKAEDPHSSTPVEAIDPSSTGGSKLSRLTSGKRAFLRPNWVGYFVRNKLQKPFGLCWDWFMMIADFSLPLLRLLMSPLILYSFCIPIFLSFFVLRVMGCHLQHWIRSRMICCFSENLWAPRAELSWRKPPGTASARHAQGKRARPIFSMLFVHIPYM